MTTGISKDNELNLHSESHFIKCPKCQLCLPDFMVIIYIKNIFNLVKKKNKKTIKFNSKILFKIRYHITYYIDFEHNQHQMLLLHNYTYFDMASI